MSEVRPVWLTKEQAEKCPFEIRDLFYAAPADPAEAVLSVLFVDNRQIVAANVLRALGMPKDIK